VTYDLTANRSWTVAGREVLTANRTYYASTTGSTSNDGLTVGNPTTLAYAISTILPRLDCNGFIPTLQLADGTYSLGATGLTLKGVFGDRVIIQGNTSNSSAVVITSTDANGTINAYTNAFQCIYDFQYIRFTNTGNGHGINCQNANGVSYGNCVFAGFGTGWALLVANFGRVDNVSRPSTIIGSMSGFAFGFSSGSFTFASATLTASSTPVWGNACIAITSLASANLFGATFSGSATGKRANVTSNAVIANAGALGVNIFGTVAGTNSTGGIYI
jgi:hypothetical protein